MPTDLNTLIIYAIAFLFVIALILIGARLLRGAGSKGNSGPSFLRGRERRLGVVEAASVDGRRKLILLKRDNVEHLIMTGGPVDVVVETGIEGPSASRSSIDEPRQPTFEKPKDMPKDDGQVVIASDKDSEAPSDDQDK